MSATDLVRYLTNEQLVAAMVPHVACCPDCPDPVDAADQRGMAVAALSAVLPGIIQQAKAEAWGEGHAAGCTDPYAKYGECGCGPNPYRERGES